MELLEHWVWRLALAKMVARCRLETGMLQARLKELGCGDEDLLDGWLHALPCNLNGVDGRRLLTFADCMLMSERELLLESEPPSRRTVLLASVMPLESTPGKRSPGCTPVAG